MRIEDFPYLDQILQKGDFTLSCGKKSDYLLDTATFLRSSRGQEFVRNLASPSPFPKQDYDVMGGPLSGADLLCRALGADKWFGVRKEQKNRGTDRGRITGNLEKDNRVLLVEDVCTSGGSLIDAAKEVIQYGGKPIGVIILIARLKYGCIANIRRELNIPVHFYYSFNN